MKNPELVILAAGMGSREEGGRKVMLSEIRAELGI